MFFNQFGEQNTGLLIKSPVVVWFVWSGNIARTATHELNTLLYFHTEMNMRLRKQAVNPDYSQLKNNRDICIYFDVITLLQTKNLGPVQYQ